MNSATWQCETCGEAIDETFEACWNCGTGRDGTVDPAFRRELDDPTVPDPGPSQETATDSTSKRRRWRPQFSLRTLMILVFLISLPCAWYGHKWRQERAKERALVRIEELGGWVQRGVIWRPGVTIRIHLDGTSACDDDLVILNLKQANGGR